MNAPVQRVLVWDWPIRVFHWGFALSTGGALVIALATDDDSPLFMWHMPLGLAAGFFLVLRLLLAMFGSRPNRLRALLFSPGETLRYLAGMFRRGESPYPHHNPGSAVFSWLMFILVPLLIWTGLGGEGGEDLHGGLAYAFLAAVGAHLAGLLLHTLRHREPIALAMLHGRKQVPAGISAIASHRWGGLAAALIALAWTVQLFRQFDPVQGHVHLPLIGTTVTLGEGADEDGEEEAEHEEEDDD